MSEPTAPELPAKWLSPADEVLAAERLREIASKAEFGYLCDAATTHFAAQTALSLIQARQATRSSLLETMKEMRELEAQIATLKAHLHGTPSSVPTNAESRSEWWVVDHAAGDQKISGPFPTMESAGVSRDYIERTQTAKQSLERNLHVKR